MRLISTILVLLSSIPAMDVKAQGFPFYRWPCLSNPYSHPGMYCGYSAALYQRGVPGIYPRTYFSGHSALGPSRMLSTRPLHLSQIVNWLERKGYEPFVEVEFEDDVWEVEAYRYGQLYELTVNPFSGKIISIELEDGEESSE